MNDWIHALSTGISASTEAYESPNTEPGRTKSKDALASTISNPQIPADRLGTEKNSEGNLSLETNFSSDESDSDMKSTNSAGAKSIADNDSDSDEESIIDTR